MACSKALGVDAIRADEARTELMAWLRESRPDLLTNTFDRPFFPVQHTPRTRAIADEYAQTLGKQHAAQILKIQDHEVKAFSPSTVVVYVRFVNPSSHSVGRTTSGKAVTILALGALNYDNGLPGIGNPVQHHDISSGEVLLFSGDALQSFNPNIDEKDLGIAILTLWAP